MAKTPADHHNDGQKDYAEGNGYNAPHGILQEIFTWPGTSESKSNIEDNQAYRGGWEHAKSQDK